MEKLVKFVDSVANANYEVANDKIKQTQRNAIKKEALDTLLETLQTAGLGVFRNDDGVVIAIDGVRHDIYLALDIVVKNLDYDLELANDEYALKLEKQAEREAKAKALAEKRK